MAEMEKNIEREIENENTVEAPESTESVEAAELAPADLGVDFQEPALDFVDGPSSLEELASRLRATNDEVSADLADHGAYTEEPVAAVDGELPENPMLVGEVEQLPMLGLEATTEAQTEEEEEIIEEPTEFIEADQLVSILESLLFATDKPVSVGVMKQIFKGSNVRTKDITRALDQLASSYASADRGVTLEEIHGGYQLRTKVDNTEYLRRLQKNRPFRLSGPALEVLAIAAYKQPITKHEVDQIRGVESGHLMRALMERGLVGFGEKSDLPGKPMTYVTTRKFLETFGLRNLNELPTLAEIDELLPEGIGEVEEKETLADLTGAMSTELKSSYTEGEEELNTIAESLKVIDTTSEFFEQEKVRQRIERDRERAQDIRERITVGEDVEDKDRRWLSRYEAKEEAAAQAAAAGAVAAPVVVEEEGEGLAAQLSALQQETHEQQAEALDSDAEADDLKAENWSADDDDETLGDLEANQDYDDESTKE